MRACNHCGPSHMTHSGTPQQNVNSMSPTWHEMTTKGKIDDTRAIQPLMPQIVEHTPSPAHCRCSLLLFDSWRECLTEAHRVACSSSMRRSAHARTHLCTHSHSHTLMC